MELSSSMSSRILTASSITNIPANAIIIPAIKSNPTTVNKNLINPLQIGDASFQKLRTITTTPVIKTSNDPINSSPTVFIVNNSNNNLIRSDSQHPMTINRLVLTNNSTTNPTIFNAQNTIDLSALVNNISSFNQITLVQSTNANTATQNSITQLLETPINVIPQPTTIVHDRSKFYFLSMTIN